MTEKTKHAAGTPCWIDIATTDTQGAKAFYSALFGWETSEADSDEYKYTMFTLRGKQVAGMGELSQEMQKQGVPVAWNLYFATDDVDATCERVKSLGGQVTVSPMDVTEAGRMAFVTDIQGASLGLWQAKQHHGAALVGEPGTLTWSELASNNMEGCRAFYSELFNWSHETKQMDKTNYTTFSVGGEQIAGMLEMNEEWEGIPPYWGVYFFVADCDASAKKAKELGGKVCVEPFDIPSIGRMAMITDPQGGNFSIITLQEPA